MIETLKEIEGYAKYFISDLGRVYSAKYKRFLKLSNHRRVYTFTILHQNGRNHTLAVHRLVAKAFLPIVEGKNIVNHKNGIKTDNRSENLEWCTQSENLYHSYATGLREKYPPRTDKRANGKSHALYKGQWITPFGEFEAADAAAKFVGLHRMIIVRRCLSSNWPDYSFIPK